MNQVSRHSPLPAVRGLAPQRRLQREEEVVEHSASVVGPFRRETEHEAFTPAVGAPLQRADGGERPPLPSRRRSRLRWDRGTEG